VSDNCPEAVRAAAVDYGRARIGFAVADELAVLAHPRPYIDAKPPQRAMRVLKGMIRAERVTLVLLGLPRNMDGSEGLSARRARKFGVELAEATGVEVRLVDERLTTVQAQGLLSDGGSKIRETKGRIDSASAAVMLQSYLDGSSSGGA